MSAIAPGLLRPNTDEAFEYYFRYIRLVPDGNIVELAHQQLNELKQLFAGISEQVASEVHAPYTWTIKQVVGHLIDAERIFADRLHRFACGDFRPLPGMDQENYVKHCDYEVPTLPALVEELCLLRQANGMLLQRLKAEAWDHRGIASGHSITVRALAYALVGHITYHLQIVRQRLKAFSLKP